MPLPDDYDREDQDYAPKLLQQLDLLYGYVERADSQPTDSAFERFDDLDPVLNGLLEELRRIVESEGSGGNAGLQTGHRPPEGSETRARPIEGVRDAYEIHRVGPRIPRCPRPALLGVRREGPTGQFLGPLACRARRRLRPRRLPRRPERRRGGGLHQRPDRAARRPGAGRSGRRRQHRSPARLRVLGIHSGSGRPRRRHQPGSGQPAALPRRPLEPLGPAARGGRPHRPVRPDAGAGTLRHRVLPLRRRGRGGGGGRRSRRDALRGELGVRPASVTSGSSGATPSPR